MYFCPYRARGSIQTKTQGVALGYGVVGLSARICAKTAQVIFYTLLKSVNHIKIKNTYIDDINKNTIKNDYSKLLTPEEHTITTENLSILEIKKDTNIMQTPFISTINPLIYFFIKT